MLRRLLNSGSPALPLMLATLAAACWGVWFLHQTFLTGMDGRVYFSLFDDGMISMRYARMLVEGHGLVWNAGEYVEGYTNPLWTMVMAGCIALAGVRFAPLMVQLLGLLVWLSCGLMAAKLAFALLRQRQATEARAGLAAVLSALLVWTYYPLAYWCILGMEVGPLAVVGLATFYMVATRWHATPTPRVLLALWALAACAYALRPDGVLIVLPPLAAWWLACLFRRRGQDLLRLSLLAAGVAAVMALHLLWRHYYYGEWVPNTYLLKMGDDPAWHRLGNGVIFLRLFLGHHWPLVVLAALAATLWRNLMAVTMLATLLGLMAYQVWVGGDPWPYWRQIVPGVVVAVPLMAVAFCSQPRRSLTALCVLLLAVGWWWAYKPYRKQMDGRVLPYQVEAAQINLRTVQVLNRLLAPDAVVAVVWAGTIPYYWPGRAYDMLGKTNREVAGLPVDTEYPVFYGMPGTVGHNRHDIGRVLREVKPDYAQVLDWGPRDDPRKEFLASGAYVYMTSPALGIDMYLRDTARRAPQGGEMAPAFVVGVPPAGN
ncbi:MAG: hypothetical protein GC129_05700 [Proteobacteria bacterium]|nr:hypothetical protein [Pseudomonadota bacterium]